MKDPKGSSWRKWDLHVHTPDSIVHNYGGGSRIWETFIEKLALLPPEIKVLGINDYIFLDGYKKVAAAWKAGKLSNLDLVLPVIELRIDKFGGADGALSKVNYHVIFSDEIEAEIIESQFLSALSSKYVLLPEYEHLRTSGKWAAVPTRKSLEDLGNLIIASTPAEKRAQLASPLRLGFNNLCISLTAIQDVLSSHYFDGKTFTAVGKTEWGEIKWSGQSAAEKRNIINSADFVFTSAVTPDDCLRARDALAAAKVNSRLLDCSDAHAFADAKEKDRLGKCFTWIKADPTFEGLRQALFEPVSRVAISEDKPLEPLLRIDRVFFDFPAKTELVSQTEDEPRKDAFCFRGAGSLIFSPYLTCLIGGRGSGKSTILNLLHEKLEPGKNTFFKNNHLAPSPEALISGCIRVDGNVERNAVEFLEQNEIERFATDPWRFTEAVFSRLVKRDDQGKLAEVNASLALAMQSAREHSERLKEHAKLVSRIADEEQELSSKKALISSFQNEEYVRISNEMAVINRELQTLRTWRERLESLLKDLSSLVSRHSFSVPENPNAFEQEFRRVTELLQSTATPQSRSPEVAEAQNRERELARQSADLKSKLDEYLRGRGLSPENLADVGKANQRAAQLEQELPALKEKLRNLEVILSQYAVDRTLPQQYATVIDELLAPINTALTDLSKEVKPIELLYEFDMPACRQTLLEHIQDCLEGANLRIDHLESMLSEVNLFDLSQQDNFLSKIPEGHKTGNALREFYSSALQFELLRIEVDRQLLEVGGFGRFRVFYDKKPVESSSFGQRCTAAIVVLLMLGNTPIVIDEPEAHLDSALIANYLVNLIKNKKVNRQIIFATHNANFVINGDAELIHILEMTDDKQSRAVSTTIEDLNHRDKLLRLEGGEEAFLKREHRYGINRR